MKKMKCLIYLAVLLAVISSKAQDSCVNLFAPSKSSRVKEFIQSPNLSDPVFRRPNVQRMMKELYAQMNIGETLGALSLEPALGEVGINLTGGFLIKDSKILFFIPILTLEARSKILLPLDFKPLKYGERQNGISPLLPEFVFAFIGAVHLFAQTHPSIEQMLITAAEIKSSLLKENLVRLGFVEDVSDDQRMILTQDLR